MAAAGNKIERKNVDDDAWTYVFKAGNYWRLSDRTGNVDRSDLGWGGPFPRYAGQYWFGCPEKN